MKLPNGIIKKSRVNPKKIVLFGRAKMGKTTILSKLDNCLILDLEKGSNFLDACSIDILSEAESQSIEPIRALKKVIDMIKESNKAKGGYTYRFIAIDTVSALEEIANPLAIKIYKSTSMGKNWKGDDILTLANGLGYYYLRNAVLTVLNELSTLCETLIISGHVKDKLIEREGKEFNERFLDLSGKLSSIVCSQVDAVGYVHRVKNETRINFITDDSLICGARPDHLRNRDVVVATSDDQNNITVDWSEIFINE